MSTQPNDWLRNYKNARVINVPRGVTEIPDHLFKNCTNLRIVRLPKSLLRIGSGAFEGCTSLEAVLCPPMSDAERQALPAMLDRWQRSAEQYRVWQLLYRQKRQRMRTLFGRLSMPFHPKLYHLSPTPPTIQGPDPKAYAGPPLQKVGDSAFRGCIHLQRVQLPDGIRKIGNRAFAGCVHLREIRLPQDVTPGANAFWGCHALGKTDPSAMIPKAAYAGRTDLERFVVPEGTEVIGIAAFAGCRRLKEVILPDSVRYISHRAFWGCKNLEQITLPPNCIPHQTAFAACPITVTLAEGTEKIHDGAFRGLRSLRRVHLPKSLQEIGADAFRDCSSLTSVYFPDGLRTIGPRAFLNCKKLTDIRLPEKMERIDKSAFHGCRRLQELTVNCKWLGDRAFYGCRSLQSLQVTNNVDRLGEETFAYCSSLHSLTILGPPLLEKKTFNESLAKLQYICLEGLTANAIPLPHWSSLRRGYLPYFDPYRPDALFCYLTRNRDYPTKRDALYRQRITDDLSSVLHHIAKAQDLEALRGLLAVEDVTDAALWQAMEEIDWPEVRAFLLEHLQNRAPGLQQLEELTHELE